jgi:hypothetical protein
MNNTGFNESTQEKPHTDSKGDKIEEPSSIKI